MSFISPAYLDWDWPWGDKWDQWDKERSLSALGYDDGHPTNKMPVLRDGTN